MTGTEYQRKAMRTAQGLTEWDLLLNGVMGLCGEAGECIDLVKKYRFQGHQLDQEKLKDEAKRQGYKLIKAKTPRFERCLCGHNVHQWVSGPKGWAVYCKHCGLYGPWAKKSHNAVIVAWNAMILEKRKEQSHEDV